jgi:predicted amidohydrolase
MKAGFLQFRPSHGNVEANLSFIERALHRSGADFVVLPEMALTGYLFASHGDLLKISEPVPGPSTERLERLCRLERMTVVCGMAERCGGGVYNSAVVVGPDGLLGTYRKSHLFTDEKDLFEKGDSGFLLFDVAGARVGVIVCFDWIFPESARTLALMGADIIAHSANLVLPYAQSAAVTRCIENRVFWILANRTGEESAGDRRMVFTGRSRVVAPGGDVIVQCDPVTPCLSVAHIDPAEARNKRVTARNDLFADRRTDLYRLG